MSSPNKLIAISGGIGSGKSVVAKILRLLGYEVYDCDSEAKRLMDESAEIKDSLRKLMGEGVINADLSINRRRLAEIVFSDSEKLLTLNGIVHGAVKNDILTWRETRKSKREPIFVETAILYQSGIDKMVDYIIEVTAPIEIRVQRVMNRNGLKREEVLQRIESQQIQQFTPHSNILYVDNGGDQPLLPQITALLSVIS
ncbi:MAG: dephospho-CoA kinase [Muribaculaceae bacterium]|nr:dephospho-CoA kinase [Muribaculaceae bacterium]